MRTLEGFIFIVVVGCLIMCSPSTTSQLESNKAVVVQLLEAINTRNYDLLDKIVTPDFVRHCQATPDVHVNSREELKQFLQSDLEVFPDSHIQLDMIIAEENMIAGYFTITATQQGDMGPFPATGKRWNLAISALCVLRMEKLLRCGLNGIILLFLVSSDIFHLRKKLKSRFIYLFRTPSNPRIQLTAIKTRVSYRSKQAPPRRN